LAWSFCGERLESGRPPLSPEKKPGLVGKRRKAEIKPAKAGSIGECTQLNRLKKPKHPAFVPSSNPSFSL
jgi:hypothetical protein